MNNPMNNPSKTQIVLAAAKKASAAWQNGFNTQDATKCAAQYEVDAVMDARPFGQFVGRDQIRDFWQKLIDDGFKQVEYIDPHYEVLDDNSVLLTSGWKMNKAQGVIHRELWCLQADGSAALREDDFEAQG